MHRKLVIATIFIAISALSTWANAQKVYRCGSTYSQTPCGSGKTLDTTSPTAAAAAAQKRARDQENKRQVEASKALAKERMAAEAEAMKRHQAQLKALEEEKQRSAQGEPAVRATPALKNKKPPEFFTAKPVTASP